MTGLNKSCFKDLKTLPAPIIVVFASLENFFAVYPTPLMTKALKEVKYKKQKGVKHKAKKRHLFSKCWYYWIIALRKLFFFIHSWMAFSHGKIWTNFWCILDAFKCSNAVYVVQGGENNWLIEQMVKEKVLNYNFLFFESRMNKIIFAHS